MTESAFDDLDQEYRELIDGAAPLAAGNHVPALLIRRARGLNEPLVGRRARFLMTSQTEDGEWLEHGWRDGLRVVSEPVAGIDGIDEPAVWIQEERDFYGGPLTANRVAVGISRMWVEQHVSTTDPVPALPPHAWLDNLNRNPNRPEIRSLQPAEGHPDPVGRRVVLVGDSIEIDLRAVSPVRMTDGGDLALTVIAERDWYRWSARDYPAAPHPSLRWVAATGVWIE